MMSEARLVFDEVRFAYTEKPGLLAGASLTVAAGEIVGVVGVNGAGKSTLLKIAVGMLAPASGRVELAGREAQGLDPREIARLAAFVPAETRVPFGFTVRELVEMGRYPYRAPFAPTDRNEEVRIKAALASVGLVELEERDFNSLSSGERRRTILARALAQDAGLLVLDEPLAHLDLRHQVIFHEVLRAAARRGAGILTVTHDLSAGFALCDRLVLLANGIIREVWRPGEFPNTLALEEGLGVALTMLMATGGGPPVAVARPRDLRNANALQGAPVLASRLIPAGSGR